VTRSRNDANSFDDLPLATYEFEFSGGDNRHEVSLEIARAGSLIRVRRVIVLAALHEVSRVRERRLDGVRFIAIRVSARVIEMKMRIDHNANVFGTNANLSEPVLERRALVLTFVLDSVNVLELLVFLVPRASVDQHQTRRMLDKKCSHAELYSVSIISRDSSFP